RGGREGGELQQWGSHLVSPLVSEPLEGPRRRIPDGRMRMREPRLAERHQGEVAARPGGEEGVSQNAVVLGPRERRPAAVSDEFVLLHAEQSLQGDVPEAV